MIACRYQWKRCVYYWVFAIGTLLPVPGILRAEDVKPAPVPAPVPAQTPAPVAPVIPAFPAEKGPQLDPLAPRPQVEVNKRDAEKAALPAPVGPIFEPDEEPEIVLPPLPRELIHNEEEQLAASERRKSLQDEIKILLEEGKKAFRTRDYRRTISIARSVMDADPSNVTAAEWIRKSQGKLEDADETVAAIAAEKRDREKLLETDEHAVTPPPRLPERRPMWAYKTVDTATLRRKKISEQLEQRVTVDFSKAELEYVLNTLFVLTGVNIIADQAAMEGKTVTMRVNEIPLKEVLNFIVRNNDGIQYSITEDAVWITATTDTDLKKIMFPRIYPLRHGLLSSAETGGGSTGSRSGGTGRSGSGGGGGGGGSGGRGGGSSRGGSGANKNGKTGGATHERSYIETVLKWMKDNKDPQVFPDGSDYLVDDQSSQLIVYTTASGHERIAEFLDAFDQPGIQVLIKSRFLQISSNDEKSLGFNLDSVATRLGGVSTAGTGTATTPAPTTTTPGTPTSGTTTTPTTTPATGTTPPATALRNPFRIFNYAGGTQPINIPGTLGNGNVLSIIGSRTNPQFQATLAALLNSSTTKVLSEPQILAVNNKQAIIDISTHFSYITSLNPVQSTNFGGNGVATQSVAAYVPEFDSEEIGFTLVVTPSVGRDLKTINLHLSPIIDSLAQGQQVTQFQQFNVSGANANTPPVIQRPTIDQTSFETDVVLEDNGYVIIGGLLQNRRDVIERKVPGLYQIPVLGNLFKSKSTTVTKNNLTIIVEAQIITPGGRTYFRKPQVDDADPREGGVNRVPGQTSELPRPNRQDADLQGMQDERVESLPRRPMPGTPPPPEIKSLPLPAMRSKPGQVPPSNGQMAIDQASAGNNGKNIRGRMSAQPLNQLESTNESEALAPSVPDVNNIGRSELNPPVAANSNAPPQIDAREHMERLTRATQAAQNIASASASASEWTSLEEEPAPASAPVAPSVPSTPVAPSFTPTSPTSPTNSLPAGPNDPVKPPRASGNIKLGK